MRVLEATHEIFPIWQKARVDRLKSNICQRTDFYKWGTTYVFSMWLLRSFLELKGFLDTRQQGFSSPYFYIKVWLNDSIYINKSMQSLYSTLLLKKFNNTDVSYKVQIQSFKVTSTDKETHNIWTVEKLGSRQNNSCLLFLCLVPQRIYGSYKYCTHLLI